MMRRDTESERIGRIGHCQLLLRFEGIGWIPANFQPDKGEDLLVRIYENGRSTGLAFYVQIKSTDNWDKLVGSETGDVKFSAAVKDFDHWNASGIPVFFFVWDIKTQKGKWIEISDEFIRQLSKNNEKWREQQSVTIRLPNENKTDDDGLRQIRRIVTDRFAPMFAQNKILQGKVKIQFPNTPEGKHLNEQMKRFRDAGDPVSLTGKYITEIEFSDWYERLYGRPKLTDKAVFNIAQQPSKKDIPAQLKLTSSKGRFVAVQNVIMRCIKRGEIEATFTNEHKPTPFYCRVVFTKENGGIRFNIDIAMDNSRPTAREAHDALPFLKGLSTGGQLTFNLSGTEKEWSYSVDLSRNAFPEVGDELEQIITNLSNIQQRTGKELFLPDWNMTYKDSFDARQLLMILEVGRIAEAFNEQSMTLGEPKSPEAAKTLIDIILKGRESDGEFSIQAEMAESFYPIMGTQIPLGPLRTDIKGRISPETIEMLQDAALSPESVDKLTLTLLDGQYVSAYDQWVSE